MAKNLTVVEIEFTDGSKAKCSLNYAMLYRLQMKRPEDYKAYNDALHIAPKEQDDFVLLRALYTAYLCMNHEKEDCMDFEEFLELSYLDPNYLSATYNKLKPKKK